MSELEKPEYIRDEPVGELPGLRDQLKQLESALKVRTGKTWTSARPTAPGWYWWRYDYSSPYPVICRLVLDEDQHLMERYDGNFLHELVDDGEWAGPLQPPAQGEGGNDNEKSEASSCLSIYGTNL